MINLEALAEDLGFDIEDVSTLVELFIESAQVSLANIEDALDGGHFDIIKNEAHAIKGSAANLLLSDIQDMARSLEEAAQDQQKMQCLTLYSNIESKVEKISEVHTSYA